MVSCTHPPDRLCERHWPSIPLSCLFVSEELCCSEGQEGGMRRKIYGLWILTQKIFFVYWSLVYIKALHRLPPKSGGPKPVSVSCLGTFSHVQRQQKRIINVWPFKLAQPKPPWQDVCPICKIMEWMDSLETMITRPGWANCDSMW